MEVCSAFLIILGVWIYAIYIANQEDDREPRVKPRTYNIIDRDILNHPINERLKPAPKRKQS